MIDIDYTFHATDGGSDHVEVRSDHVPRVGELAVFGLDRFYQVVDVLWQVNDGKHTSVVVTACERNWHEHIRDVVDAYDRQHRPQ